MIPQISEEDVIFVHHTTTDKFSVVRGASFLNQSPTSEHPLKYAPQYAPQYAPEYASQHASEQHDQKCRPRSSRYSSQGPGFYSDDRSNVVDVQSFHYVSKYKHVICRCLDPKHDKYRRVYNFEIRTLTAEFFQRNPDKDLCCREEWRATFRSLLVEKRPENTISKRPDSTSSRRSDSTSSRRSDSTSSRRSDSISFRRPERHASRSEDCRNSDHIDFDRESLFQFLQDLDLEDRRSHPRSPTSSRKSRTSSRQIRNGPNGELDMPKKVWRDARPSVYSERHGLDSTVSTPLGETSGFDFRDTYNGAKDSTWVPAPLNPTRRSPSANRPLSEASAGQPAPTRTRARHAANQDIFARLAMRRGPVAQTSWDTPSASEFEAASSPEGNFAASYSYANEIDSTSVSELPGAEVAAELSTRQCRVPSYHLHTLRELEGGGRRGGSS